MSAITRRKFLFTAGAATLSLAAYNAFDVLSYRVERIEVPLRALPAALDGLTIAQLSDVHFNEFIGERYFSSVAATINELKPDVVALTGDYVTYPLTGDPVKAANAAYPCADVISTLRPRFTTIATLGNHDHTTSVRTVRDAFTSRHINVLQNRAIPVEHRGDRIWFAGIDSASAARADFPGTMRQVPRTECCVALIHEPDPADIAVQHGVSFQMSGHSHGGQVRLPFIGAPILPQLAKKYPIGLRKIGELTLYTNRGIGVVGLPVRFLCPPEITFFTLRRASSG